MLFYSMNKNAAGVIKAGFYTHANHNSVQMENYFDSKHQQIISYNISISLPHPHTHQSSENVVIVLCHHTHGQGLKREKACD